MSNNAKENFWARHKVLTWTMSSCIVLVFIFMAYEMGYRVTSDFTVGKVGKVSLALPLEATNIYIDNSQKIISTEDNQTIDIPLSPKSHTIIVSKDGYFPWKKTVTVPSNSQVSISPLFVSTSASGNIITKNDPEYLKLRNAIITDALPTKDAPKVSHDGTTKLWLEDSGIMAMVGSTTVKVLDTDTTIRNVSFYKDTSTAVIFSTTDGVYVIEIDKKGNQNFMPIYKGIMPSFIATDPNFIYVLDGETLMQVMI